MGKINREWHETHPMPPRATLDERIAWHVEHAENCACRDMPQGIKDELKRRGMSLNAEAPPADGAGPASEPSMVRLHPLQRG